MKTMVIMIKLKENKFLSYKHKWNKSNLKHPSVML